MRRDKASMMFSHAGGHYFALTAKCQTHNRKLTEHMLALKCKCQCVRKRCIRIANDQLCFIILFFFNDDDGAY